MNTTQLKAVIERFDGDIAIIETLDGDVYEIPKSQLPKGCKVGHHLRMEKADGEITEITIDKEATAEARKNIDDLMARLRRGEHLKDDED